MMEREEFENLNIGDIVQHVGTGEGYVIISARMQNGRRVYEAVRSIQLSNPSEWKVVRKGK